MNSNKLQKGDSCILQEFKDHPDKLYSTIELNKTTQYTKESIRNSLSRLHKLDLIKKDSWGFYSLNRNNMANSSIYSDNFIQNEVLVDYFSKILNDGELPKVHGIVIKKIDINTDYDTLNWEIKGGDKAKFHQSLDDLGKTTIRLHKKCKESNNPNLRIEFSQDNLNGEKNPLDLQQFQLWKAKTEGFLKATFNQDIKLDDFEILQLGIGKDIENIFINNDVNLRFNILEDMIIECYNYERKDGKIVSRFCGHVSKNEDRPINSKVSSLVSILTGIGRSTEILTQQDTMKDEIKDVKKNQQFNNEYLQKLNETNKALLDAIPKINDYTTNLSDEVHNLQTQFKNQSNNQIQIVEQLNDQIFEIKTNTQNDVEKIYRQIEANNYLLKKSIHSILKLVNVNYSNFQQFIIQSNDEKKELTDLLTVALDNQKKIIELQTKKKKSFFRR